MMPQLPACMRRILHSIRFNGAMSAAVLCQHSSSRQAVAATAARDLPASHPRLAAGRAADLAAGGGLPVVLPAAWAGGGEAATGGGVPCSTLATQHMHACELASTNVV